jgi:hypothetical protein
MKELMPGLSDTLGTGFYLIDPDGSLKLDKFDRAIINPKHRGRRGDFEFRGDSRTLSDVENT